MQRFLFRSLLALILIPSCSQKEDTSLQTPLEKNKFQKTTSHAGLIKFLEVCDSLSEDIRLSLFPLQDSCFLPVVEIYRDTFSPDRLNIFFMAQQHGNEPAGMEGLSMLIRDFANGGHSGWLDSLNLIIIPQCNPWGADRNRRKNQEGTDLNRDHVVLTSKETQIIQSVFHTFSPLLTVDFHEYYPFGESWDTFGYRRNFDIQLGGPTNANIPFELRDYFKKKLLPSIQSRLQENEISTFEYTLGDFPHGERLRHSTTDINDGRQSFGITGSLSLIVEGMNGKDSLHNIQHRAFCHYQTALALIGFAYQNKQELHQQVSDARKKITNPDSPVSIRQEHFQGKEILVYPLLSLRTGRDTVFRVEAYHPEVRSLLDVVPPVGYLIPSGDSMLVKWLKRTSFHYSSKIPENVRIIQYSIKELLPDTLEGLPLWNPRVERIPAEKKSNDFYYYIPAGQLYRMRIILALEPQSAWGLATYTPYYYLLKQKNYPILRVE